MGNRWATIVIVLNKDVPLNLYRRHFRTAGKYAAGYLPDFRNYESDELRRGWKRCHCPIYADGTLRGRFKRRNTKKASWNEAKEVATQWERADRWENKARPRLCQFLKRAIPEVSRLSAS